jgi:hypothetical protein
MQCGAMAADARLPLSQEARDAWELKASPTLEHETKDLGRRATHFRCSISRTSAKWDPACYQIMLIKLCSLSRANAPTGEATWAPACFLVAGTHPTTMLPNALCGLVADSSQTNASQHLF